MCHHFKELENESHNEKGFAFQRNRNK